VGTGRGRRLAAALLAGATSLVACSSIDPALRQALADATARPSKGRVALRPFAEQGNALAIARICVAYGQSIDSEVGQRERARAFAWCEHAARAGDLESQYHLGMFLKSGIGTLEDKSAALHWYREAAARGHRLAENEARGLEGQARLCSKPITGCRMF